MKIKTNGEIIDAEPVVRIDDRQIMRRDDGTLFATHAHDGGFFEAFGTLSDYASFPVTPVEAAIVVARAATFQCGSMASPVGALAGALDRLHTDVAALRLLQLNEAESARVFAAVERESFVETAQRVMHDEIVSKPREVAEFSSDGGEIDITDRPDIGPIESAEFRDGRCHVTRPSVIDESKYGPMKQNAATPGQSRDAELCPRCHRDKQCRCVAPFSSAGDESTEFKRRRTMVEVMNSDGTFQRVDIGEAIRREIGATVSNELTSRHIAAGSSRRTSPSYAFASVRAFPMSPSPWGFDPGDPSGSWSAEPPPEPVICRCDWCEQRRKKRSGNRG